jgi:hypothetical protein
MSLPISIMAWPPEAIEELEERSAIVEYLAKVPRERAERIAEEFVRARWRKGEPGYKLTAHPRAFRRFG